MLPSCDEGSVWPGCYEGIVWFYLGWDNRRKSLLGMGECIAFRGQMSRARRAIVPFCYDGPREADILLKGGISS